MAKIKIVGLEKVMGILDNLEKGENVKKAVVNATASVHGQAKALAPVDTGTLRAGIHMRVEISVCEIEGRVYTNINYAPFVEFGTGIKGTGTYPNKNVQLTYRQTPWTYTPDGKSFYRTSGQVAQPFMYPAMQLRKKQIIKDIINGLEKDLKG